MSKRIVIHRDMTFTFDGDTYHCQMQGPRGSGDEQYLVTRERDGREVGDFATLADIREFAERAMREGWPLVEEAVTYD